MVRLCGCITTGSGATQKSVFPESTETTGSRSHPELRVPGVKRNSGFLESTGILPGVRRNYGLHIQPEIRVHAVTWKSMFPESPTELRVAGDTRKSGFPLVTRNSGFPDSTGTLIGVTRNPGSRSHPEPRVPGVKRSPGFPE